MTSAIGPLTELQRASWHSMGERRLTICEGAVRSGKSVGADHAFLDFALHGPLGNLLLTGKTQDTVKRNVIDPLAELFGKRFVRFNRGTRELFIGERRIYVVGANDERAQERIRGLTLVGAYVDEASTLPESYWQMLLTRLSVAGARLIATTNPDSPHHWLKRNFLDKRGQLDLGVFSFRLDDNPYLDASYVEAMKVEFTGLWYKRFILGQWVAAEGAIYDMLDLSEYSGDDGGHLLRELPDLSELTLSIDYGTSNPLHALLAGVDAHGRLIVAREWRYSAADARRQLTDAEYSERLRTWLAAGAEGFSREPVRVERVVIDPSAASFKAQLKRDCVHGLWGDRAVRAADNAVLDGIRETASLLAVRRLLLHASTHHLQRELSGYVWDPKAQERGEDAPVKVDDHGCDSLRYLCRSRRPRRSFVVRGA